MRKPTQTRRPEIKQKSDVVIVSFHWGVHFVRSLIADYQPIVAHAAIDAGADVILGHHQHILKGVEVYRGKVIFYGIGNFALDSGTDEGRSADLEWKACAKKFIVITSAGKRASSPITA